MKLVVFSVSEKEYGVDIAQVREAIRTRPITPVPDAAEFVEGVISLRGRIIPIISLRKKLGMEQKELAKSNRILITHVNNHLVGVIVDSVSEVISLGSEDITPPDEVLKKAGYLTGVGRIGSKLFLVIDIEKLLTDKEITGIAKVHKKVEVKKKKHVRTKERE